MNKNEEMIAKLIEVSNWLNGLGKSMGSFNVGSMFWYYARTQEIADREIMQKHMDSVVKDMLTDYQKLAPSFMATIQREIPTLQSSVMPLKSLQTHENIKKVSPTPNSTPSQILAKYGEKALKDFEKRFYIDYKRDVFIKR